MATFSELYTEIEADLGVDNSDFQLRDLIKSKINLAIESYESERFTFNEGPLTTFSTAIGDPDYTKAANWPRVQEFDQVQALYSSRLYDLDEESYDWYVRAINDQTGITGPPKCYVVYGETLYIYPTPNLVTTITISGLHTLTPRPLSADSDTNAWLVGDAFQMIKARVKADLFSHRLYNKELLQLNAGIANDFLENLRGDRDRLTMTDVQKPATDF